MPAVTKTRKRLRRLAWLSAGMFLLVNIIAACHAWRFTHFSGQGARHANPAALSAAQKLGMALKGADNPRPATRIQPARPYRTFIIQSNVPLDAWYMAADSPAKGTVILFHGYGAEKSSMLEKAYLLLDAGYNVLLPDFMGAGGAGGNQTTIGYREAGNVKSCYEYVSGQLHEPHIILLGTSMGAAAVLKYLDDGNTQPAAVILECPFGTMYRTVCRRFEMVHAPVFPLAALLVFWGGVENGFWAFGHNPEAYARSVKCPALLLYGEKDDRVTRAETDAIFRNLAGPRALHTYPLAGHNSFMTGYRDQWRTDVLEFLSACPRRDR